MRTAFISLLLLASLLIFTSPDSLHARATTQPAPMDWKPLVNAMGEGGTLKDDVYTYTLPRNDLHVSIDGMDVPTGAGLSSVFNFYKCPCGHMQVAGQFCCADYESDDVIDALRPGALIKIVSVGPLFIGEHPRVTIVRFQGDGDVEALVKLLKNAGDWMGERRNHPATQPARQ